MRYKEQYGYEILSDDVAKTAADAQYSFLVLDEDDIPIVDGKVMMGPKGFKITLLWCGYVSLIGMQKYTNDFFQKVWNETFA